MLCDAFHKLFLFEWVKSQIETHKVLSRQGQG